MKVKSIAVLPFTNLSDDKDSRVFADGVREDVLTDLAIIRDLHVESRTSVEQYRDTKKPMGQIGTELGVAYLLEGASAAPATRFASPVSSAALRTTRACGRRNLIAS